MSDRVYRLDVSYPPHSHALDWEPDNWVSPYLGDGPPDADYSFRWPRPKRCLSRTTAERWARQLREWGATVVVVESLPIEWP